MQVNNKKLEFPKSMKEKLNNFVKRDGLDIEYVNGEIITYDTFNVECLVSFQIILICKNKILKFIYYGDYDENKNRFYTADLKEEISLNKLKELANDLRDTS